MMVQLAPPASWAGATGQELVWLKSPLLSPVMAIPQMFTADPATLVSVILCGALLVPTS